MGSSIIDLLLPSQPRASGDSHARSGEGGAPFGPVLNDALRADAPPTPSPLRSESSQPIDSDEELQLDDGGDGDHAELDSPVEASPGDSHVDESATQDDETDEDAVEISEEAAALAAAPAATNEEAQSELDLAAAAKVDATEAIAAADADAAADAAAAQNAGTTENDDGDEAPTLLEYGDLIAKKSKTGDATGKQAEAATAKSKAQAARNATAQAEAPIDETAVADDEATDALVRRAAHAAEAASSTAAPDDGGASSADASIGGAKRGAAPQSATAVVAAAAVAGEVAAPGHSASGGAEAPVPATPDISLTPAFAAAAPTSAARGGGALARLTAERSIQATASNGADDGPGGVDRTRFVGRVEGAIRAAHQRDGRVTVRLSPPELGALRIELTMHQGGLTARVDAETSAARNMLLDNLPALRERLAQQGVQIERFDVDVRQEGGGSGDSAKQSADERAAREADDRRATARRETHSRVTSKPAPAAARTSIVNANAGLDVSV